MAKKRRVFLETTIQGERIFAEKYKKDAIKKNLKNQTVCTSGFVLNQFKKTFLYSAICFYNLLIDSENPHTALRRSSKYSERIHKRISQVFATLCDEEKNDKESAVERLETWIEDGLMIEFLEGIEEPIIDKTSCKWVSGDPVKVANRYEIAICCRKDRPPACNIERFWNEHNKELDSLASAVDLSKDKDRELKKINTIAKQIRDGFDRPFGLNCTVYLSDALIAVEAPKGSEIYTTNKKHFEPICAIIGNRKVYKEVL